MSSSTRHASAHPGVHSDSDELVREISAIVSSIAGIQLGERQKAMVASRIQRRFSELGMKTFAEYISYFRAHLESESDVMVSRLTTHHTYFFREIAHFEFLERTALPSLIAEKKKRGENVLRLWSAACSSGQEAYSLSMFVRHFLSRHAPEMTYEIYGTDIDPESVKHARNGVYRFHDVQEIPTHFLSGNWAKGTGSISEFAKAKDTIKSPCRFEVMNLLKMPESLLRGNFDIIFCRNVFIYFNQDQIRQITKGLLKALAPDGYLFAGISESLSGLQLPVTTVGPSIYRKAESVMRSLPLPLASKSKGADPEATLGSSTVRAPSLTIASTPPVGRPAAVSMLKVLCVDDSPSILALLKKILTPDAGFQVVGTASNGQEAEQWLKTNKADLMTLDIHMPIQTGLEFLQTHQRRSLPPVVMISSVSRQDAALALKCLELGATDYIEKPSLASLSARSDEIRSKLRYAHEFQTTPRDISVIRSFSKTRPTIGSPEHKRRVVVAGFAAREQLANMLAEFVAPEPATYVLVESAGEAIEAFRAYLASCLPGKTILTANPTNTPNAIFLSDANTLSRLPGCENTSILIFGRPSASLVDSLSLLNAGQVLVEDRGERAPNLETLATDVVPTTSFAYMSDEFFARGAK
ncbi:MAG: response regulator [Bdellovibrionaceae bacterium]|nr:response regulator [Pseudobdellovibrionaceae bacterium]